MKSKATITITEENGSITFSGAGDSKSLRIANVIQYLHEMTIGAKSVVIDGKILEKSPDTMINEALSFARECDVNG